MDDIEKAYSHLMTAAETHGVGTVRVKDGHLYSFSRKKLEELIKVCEEKGEDVILVFVKTGPDISDVKNTVD